MNFQYLLLKLGVRQQIADQWVPVLEQGLHAGLFSRGADEIDDFLGNVCHESGHFERLSENLNYSAEGLMKTWPTRSSSKPTICARWGRGRETGGRRRRNA